MSKLLEEYKTDRSIWEQNIDTPNLRSDILGSKRVLDLLGDVTNKRILDLGCGNGKVSRTLAKAGAKVVGVDKTKEQVLLAKKFHYPNLEYFLGDIVNIEKLNLSNQFDIVLSLMAHLYIPKGKILKSFQTAYNHTKKSGRFIYLNIHPCRFLWENKADAQTNYFTTPTFTAEFSTASNKVFTTTYFNHPLELIVNSITQAGYKIKQVLEPQATKAEMTKYPTMFSKEDKLPSYFIIDCYK